MICKFCEQKIEVAAWAGDDGGHRCTSGEQHEPTGPTHEARPDKFVQSAWCSFGTDVLRHPDNMIAPDEGFTYNALTGRLLWVPAHDAEGLALAQDVMADADVAAQQPSVLRRRELVFEALARNLGRVLRWGGSSTCSVLAHSVRVAHLAAAVARHLPTKPDATIVASCRRLGALHDLHEGLPGVGDVPSPLLRVLRRTVPTIDRIHTQAENLVLDLAGARSLLAGLAPAAVKFADRLAATVERAAYFSDAPARMAPDLQRAGEKMLRSTLPRTCRRWDDKATPEGLLYLAKPDMFAPNQVHVSSWPAWCDDVLAWCDDVLACLDAPDRPWQSVLADMVPGT